jgi:hypothetical protein
MPPVADWPTEKACPKLLGQAFSKAGEVEAKRY